MADGRHRSEAEREAARLERERRRAQRLGHDSPAPVDPGPPPPPPPHPHPPLEPDPQAAGNGTSKPDFAPLPPPEVEPVVRRGPGHLAGEEDEPASEDHELAFGDGEFGDGEFADGDGEDDHELDGWDEGDRPAGTRRVSALQRMTDAPDGQRGRTRKAKPPRAARRGSGRRRIASLLALALAGGLIWFLVQLFQPFHGSPHGRIQVVVPAHSSAGQIGDLLERDGVISSGFFFKLRATLAGDRSNLRSGTYQLQLGMSYSKVLDVLTTAPKRAPVSDLTLVPGRTRAEINKLLRTQGIHGSYTRATRHSKLLDPRAYGAPRSTPSLEGFLFPDTYQLKDPITVSALVADQLKNFRRHFGAVNLRYARSKHLTPYDVLIIASMVEAEAATTHDRPLVASVIYNRLSRGMPLQIDATTRYATGNYSSPLTVSQLNSASPYNTRIHTGLPPTPIDNPSLSAITAAAHPGRNNYLYFVVKPCGNGEQTFTGSYAQFLRDSAAYQQARASAGGRSPAVCAKK